MFSNDVIYSNMPNRRNQDGDLVWNLDIGDELSATVTISETGEITEYLNYTTYSGEFSESNADHLLFKIIQAILSGALNGVITDENGDTIVEYELLGDPQEIGGVDLQLIHYEVVHEDWPEDEGIIGGIIDPDAPAGSIKVQDF